MPQHIRNVARASCELAHHRSLFWNCGNRAPERIVGRLALANIQAKLAGEGRLCLEGAIIHPPTIEVAVATVWVSGSNEWSHLRFQTRPFRREARSVPELTNAGDLTA